MRYRKCNKLGRSHLETVFTPKKRSIALLIQLNMYFLQSLSCRILSIAFMFFEMASKRAHLEFPLADIPNILSNPDLPLPPDKSSNVSPGPRDKSSKAKNKQKHITCPYIAAPLYLEYGFAKTSEMRP